MVELTLRIAFSLAVVLFLMWGLARMARRPLLRGRGQTLVVLARQQLTRGSAVAVVRVADRALVIGVTEQAVSLLTEADLEALEQVEAAPAKQRALIPAAQRSQVPLADQDSPVRVAAAASGALAGSVLSPATWRQAIEFFRERTVRRA